MDYELIEDRITSLCNGCEKQRIALNELAYQLHWVKGHAKHTHEVIHLLMGKENVLSEWTFSDDLYFNIQQLQQGIIQHWIEMNT